MITRLFTAFVLVIGISWGADMAKKPAESPRITITVGQLIQIGATGSLQRLEQQSFPPVLSLRIHRLGAIVDPEINRVIQEQGKMFTDLNSTEVTVEGKKSRQIKPEFLKEYRDKMIPFFQEKIELAITPLILSDLPEDTKISAWDIEVLGPLIRTGEEDSKPQEPKK